MIILKILLIIIVVEAIGILALGVIRGIQAKRRRENE